MAKATVASLQAQVEALMAQLKAVQAAPAAKAYQAGLVKEGEALTVPKGHVALLVPMLATEKLTGKGLRYVAETRGVALHKGTGAGFKFGAWITEAEVAGV